MVPPHCRVDIRWFMMIFHFLVSGSAAAPKHSIFRMLFPHKKANFSCLHILLLDPSKVTKFHFSAQSPFLEDQIPKLLGVPHRRQRRSEKARAKPPMAPSSRTDLGDLPGKWAFLAAQITYTAHMKFIYTMVYIMVYIYIYIYIYVYMYVYIYIHIYIYIWYMVVIICANGDHDFQETMRLSCVCCSLFYHPWAHHTLKDFKSTSSYWIEPAWHLTGNGHNSHQTSGEPIMIRHRLRFLRPQVSGDLHISPPSRVDLDDHFGVDFLRTRSWLGAQNGRAGTFKWFLAYFNSGNWSFINFIPENWGVCPDITWFHWNWQAHGMPVNQAGLGTQATGDWMSGIATGICFRKDSGKGTSSSGRMCSDSTWTF